MPLNFTLPSLKPLPSLVWGYEPAQNEQQPDQQQQLEEFKQVSPDSDKQLLLLRQQQQQQRLLLRHQHQSKHKKCCHHRLSSWGNAPSFLKHNSSIISGYRTEYCFSHALFSLFEWHNETLNVWTHFLGFVFFAYLGLDACFGWMYQATLFEKFLFLCHIWMIAAAFLMSSIYHLFGCLNHQCHLLLCSLDYTGITLIISTGYHFPAHFMFLCWPFMSSVYFAVMTLLGALCMLLNWHPTLLQPHYQTLRTYSFMALAATGVAIFPTSLMVNGWEWTEPALLRAIITIAIFVCGVSFYISFFPEKWWPGRFDIAFQSHTIFHCFIVAGCYAHYLNFAFLYQRQLFDGLQCQ